MDRKEFLSALGYSSGALVFAACLDGCKKSDTSDSNNTTPAPTVDFTLDLTLPANTALNTNGGYVYSNGVIVAKSVSGVIIAVSQACTHQGTSVQYVSNTNQFFCPNHSANFSATGSVISGPVNVALKQYTVTVNGNMVRVVG